MQGGVLRMYMEQLYYLTALGYCQSLSQAADVCFVSQPALSKALGNLEKELGLKLFSRAHDGYILTEDGQQMVHYAEQIVALLDEMKSFANHYPDKEQLHFSAVASICNTILSDILTAFHYRYPKMQVSVKSLPTEEVLDQLLSRKADLGIIALPSLESKRKKHLFDNNELQFSLLFRCQTFLWISADHPLFLQNAVTVDNLIMQNYAYILAGTGYESPKLILEDKYYPTIETADRNLIVKLILTGDMFSILPSLYNVNEPLIENGAIKTLPYEKGSFLEYYLVLRKSYILQPAERDFIMIMNRIFSDLELL